MPTLTWRTWAPGRVNLIGEHTDYNQGRCLPIAIGVGTTVVANGRPDDLISLRSDADDLTWQGRAGDARPGSVTGWVGYAAGVLWALEEAGLSVPGMDLRVSSTVPIGAGLSSSASLEAAVAVAAWHRAGRALDDAARALLVDVCRRAETEVVGAPTGGLDQRAVLEATEGSALLLDFADGMATPVPLPLEAQALDLLVVDTRTRHALVTGDYGSRRQECRDAARALGVGSLRSATLPMVEALPDPMLRRRARHVVTENERVVQATAAIRRADWPALGAVMTASHASMRDDFEISRDELDLVVDTALEAGALGARMTGGGFGGSAIALVPRGLTRGVRGAVDRAFEHHSYAPPAHLDGLPAGPARVVGA